MRGMQNAVKLEERASSEDRYRALPEGNNWSVSFGDKTVTGIYCENPEALEKIKAIFPEGCNGKAPVYRTDPGTFKVREELGTLDSVTGEHYVKDIMPEIRQASELSDRVETKSKKDESSDADIIDFLSAKANSDNSRNFYEAKVFQTVFSQRPELGMSIDYFTRKKKDGSETDQLRYRRRKKEGVAGGWVSKDYVYEAVSAINKYDKLSKSENLEDLSKAFKIANTYFTEKSRQIAQTKIAENAFSVLYNQRNWKSLLKAEKIALKYLGGTTDNKAYETAKESLFMNAVVLADRAAAGKINRNTSMQIAARLSVSNDPRLLSRAVDIGKAMQMPERFVEAVSARLQTAAWKNYDKTGSLMRKDRSNPETLKPIYDPGIRLDEGEPTRVIRSGKLQPSSIPPAPADSGLYRTSGSEEVTRKVRIPQHILDYLGRPIEKIGETTPDLPPAPKKRLTPPPIPKRRKSVPPPIPPDAKRRRSTPPPLPWNRVRTVRPATAPPKPILPAYSRAG